MLKSLPPLTACSDKQREDAMKKYTIIAPYLKGEKKA